MKRKVLIQNSILGLIGLLIFYGLLFYARVTIPITPLSYDTKTTPITATSSPYSRIKAIFNNPVSILVPEPISLPSASSTDDTSSSTASEASSTPATDASSTSATDASSTSPTDASSTTSGSLNDDIVSTSTTSSSPSVN